MEIKQLNRIQVQALYESRMKEDFPTSELRSLANMLVLIQLDKYLCYGFEENGEILAYAFFIVTNDAVLLDYFAVDASLRGKGIGSKFLKELSGDPTRFPSRWIFIEVESVESAQNEEEAAIREKRQRFYTQCGASLTQIYALLFSVEYRILCLPLADEIPSDDTTRQELEQIYKMIVTPLTKSPDDFHKKCRVSLGREGLLP